MSEDAQTTSETPQSIADEFKESIRAIEEEDKIKLAVPGVRRGAARTPKKDVPPRPEWESKKIGMVACYLHDAIFAAYDMPALEPEEQDSLSATAAYYLNERWPEGAKYEPEMRLAAELSGLWVPRIMAKQRGQNTMEEVEAIGTNDYDGIKESDIGQAP